LIKGLEPFAKAETFMIDGPDPFSMN